ncbi:MAG: hypothetical protein VKL59_13665 [Nostocaceae cyanobacterium]|nr:hypothetical protein [Nostocaceae cyanobacterium]
MKPMNIGSGILGAALLCATIAPAHAQTRPPIVPVPPVVTPPVVTPPVVTPPAGRPPINASNNTGTNPNGFNQVIAARAQQISANLRAAIRSGDRAQINQALADARAFLAATRSSLNNRSW